MIGGVSTLGEELGWRGFLRRESRDRSAESVDICLSALMWEAWHFTSHLKGTVTEVVSRMSIYIPLVVAVTFLLGFVVERTDSLLLAVTLHGVWDRYRCRQWWNLPDVGCAGVHSALALAPLDVGPIGPVSTCPHRQVKHER